MKKSLLSLAVVAGMAVSSAALADMKIYGNAHVSLNDFDSAVNGMNFTSNTSHLGFKAAEDVGDGMKVFAKMEFQPDVIDGGAFSYRDAFIGIKGGMGTAKFGQYSNNYKQMGGKVDPMYRTVLEGRGFMNTQSKLHGGRGVAQGRMTNQLQLTSSKMGGIQAVVNTTFSNSKDETTGFGIRYAGKGFKVYFDTISVDVGTATTKPEAPSGVTESAIKFGGYYKTGALKVSAQIEQTEDVTGEDYTFLGASYKLNKNDSVAFSYGIVAGKVANTDRTGLALMYKHKMSKMTNVYAGYGDRADDVTVREDSAITFGIQKKF